MPEESYIKKAVKIVEMEIPDDHPLAEYLMPPEESEAFLRKFAKAFMSNKGHFVIDESDPRLATFTFDEDAEA